MNESKQAVSKLFSSKSSGVFRRTRRIPLPEPACLTIVRDLRGMQPDGHYTSDGSDALPRAPASQVRRKCDLGKARANGKGLQL